eukprot:7237560-Prymnesium_polylepis.2
MREDLRHCTDPPLDLARLRVIGQHDLRRFGAVAGAVVADKRVHVHHGGAAGPGTGRRERREQVGRREDATVPRALEIRGGHVHLRDGHERVSNPSGGTPLCDPKLEAVGVVWKDPTEQVVVLDRDTGAPCKQRLPPLIEIRIRPLIDRLVARRVVVDGECIKHVGELRKLQIPPILLILMSLAEFVADWCGELRVRQEHAGERHAIRHGVPV